MKHALFLSAGFLALAACNGSGEDVGAGQADSLKADCIVIANDPEGVEEIASMGTDAEGFCSCVERVVAAMPEDDGASVKSIMSKVADGMQETGRGTEDVVGGMISDAMANPDDMDAQATQTGVRRVGGMFDDIADGFEETGNCPAS